MQYFFLFFFRNESKNTVWEPKGPWKSAGLNKKRLPYEIRNRRFSIKNAGFSHFTLFFRSECHRVVTPRKIFFQIIPWIPTLYLNSRESSTQLKRVDYGWETPSFCYEVHLAVKAEQSYRQQQKRRANVTCYFLRNFCDNWMFINGTSKDW